MDKVRAFFMISQVQASTGSKCKCMKKFALEMTSLLKGDKHGSGYHDPDTPYAIEVSGTWDSNAKTTYLLDFSLLLDNACVYALKLLKVFSASGLVADFKVDRFITLLCRQLLFLESVL